MCYTDGGKTLVSKDLLISDKASAKMSEFDLITFVGISESWHAFDESRFNISFSISAFEILLNLKYLFVLLPFVATILGWFLYVLLILLLDAQYDRYLLTRPDILEYLDFKLHW